MSTEFEPIDALLAAALRGEAVARSPVLADARNANQVHARIRYHGVAGLLGNAPGALDDWPDPLAQRVRGDALVHAMWELRHRHLIADLLGQLRQAGVKAVLLKGTAMAYDLYDPPASRVRGDSDLLVARGDVPRVRRLLAEVGFRPSESDGGNDGFALQEGWVHGADGGARHHLDLHWQVLNTPSLERALPLGDCLAGARPLPRLSAAALAMDRVAMLIHAAIHRSLHVTAPYFVDGAAHHGGDRLIWLYDVHLLAKCFSDAQWAALASQAERSGVAALCHDALATAARLLATPVPAAALATLAAAAQRRKAPAYLRSRQLGRVWEDFKATPGVTRRIAFVRHRTLPPQSFMRAKYPHMGSAPLVLLYARRLIDLLRPRPRRSER